MALRCKLLCFICVFLVIGCAQKVSSISKGSEFNLHSDSGHLLIGIDTNRQLQSINIRGEKNIIITQKDIQKGSNLILVELPPGDYRIKSIKLSKYFAFKLFDDMWNFEVKKGGVSYVGHLKVKSTNYWFGDSHIELENRSTEAIEYLENNFEDVLQRSIVKYSGPGKDEFLESVAMELVKGYK